MRLAEPIALTSIFPYSWELVKRYGAFKEEDASFYSGLLISAFSLAEAITGMFWGALSDKVGRKPVLLCGSAGTALSMLIIGFARSFWVAIAGRLIGGLLNGNISVIQTMVGELVIKPEHEPRAYSVMPFVWSVGSIIGPAIGGTFVDPARSFPHIFSDQGLFGRFPYLLSNLICAGILLLGILAGYFLLEETNSNLKNCPESDAPLFITEQTPLIVKNPNKDPVAVMKRPKTYIKCLVHAKDAQGKLSRETSKQRVFTPRVINLAIAIAIFCYHSMSFDQLLPIFLEDKSSHLASASYYGLSNLLDSDGLGMSVQQVGFIMSVDGIIALFVLAFIFPYVVAYFGVYQILIIVSLFQPITFLIMPYLIYLPTYWLYTGIYTCLVFRNLVCILAFSSLLILIKEASPSLNVLGKVNGLAASAGAVSRTIAPPIAGYLYGLGAQLMLPSLVWYMCALIAGVGAFQIFMIQAPRRSVDEEDWRDEDVLTPVYSSLNTSEDYFDDDSSGVVEIGTDSVAEDYR